MGLDPRLHPVILAEGIHPYDRPQLLRTMFEIFEVPSLCIAESAVLALYAIGRSTGVVIDFGEAQVTFTPVYQGAVMRDFIKCFSVGMSMIKNACKVSGFPFAAEGSMKNKFESYAKFDPVTTEFNILLHAPELYFNTSLIPGNKATAHLPISVVRFVYPIALSH